VSEGAFPPLKNTSTLEQPWQQHPGVYSLTGIPYESVMLVAAVTFFLMGSVTSSHNQRDGDRRVERRVPSPLLPADYSGFPELNAASGILPACTTT
jgi:hypothetical protein